MTIGVCVNALVHCRRCNHKIKVYVFLTARGYNFSIGIRSTNCFARAFVDALILYMQSLKCVQMSSQEAPKYSFVRGYLEISTSCFFCTVKLIYKSLPIEKKFFLLWCVDVLFVCMSVIFRQSGHIMRGYADSHIRSSISI